MKILITIVTYNRCSTLEKSIISHQNDGIELKDILVVDNNSSDGTLEMLANDFPDVNLVKNEDNIGSAGGFAVCMEYGVLKGYDYVWLYNDDSRPLSGANDLMRQTLNDLKSPKLGMVKMGMLKDGKSEASYWKNKRVTKWVPQSNLPFETSLITFDGCVISTKLIKECGTCNPQFFMGIYEFDFCLRASEKNYKIYTLPAGLIDDEKKGSAGGTPYWRSYYVTRNHLYLMRKRKKTSEIFSFIKLEINKILGVLLKGNDKKRKLKYKLFGIRDGFKGKMGKTVLPK